MVINFTNHILLCTIYQKITQQSYQSNPYKQNKYNFICKIIKTSFKQQISMYKNLFNGNSQKISKVIQLAVSYKNHRKSLQRIKPAINMPSLNLIKKTDQLTVNRIRYAEESRNLKKSFIQKENQSQSKRIQRTQSLYKRVRNPQTVQTSRINSSQVQKSKSKSRLDSRSSLHSCDSQRSICSNFMSRTRRYKQIENQNKQLAARVSNPRVNKSMRIKQLDKTYAKEQQYLKVRSRFSDRSKSIMQSLMLDGLKMNRKHLQFLPQIGSPRGETNHTDSKNYLTISKSKTQIGDNNEDNRKHMKTLQFAKNMRKQIKKSRLIKQ